MIKYVSCLTDNEYETEEEAREAMREEMDWNDYMNHLTISIDEIFTRLRNAGVDYFGIFENEFYEAENEYFNENYSVIETEDEDEG